MTGLLAALLWLQLAPNTGSISGTVIRSGSEQRLEGTRVELSGGSGRPLVQRTDGEGRFAFSSVSAGTYHLRVSKDGYVRQEFARRAAIVIQPGMVHRPVTLELQLAPTFSGRVMNENGDAIPGIVVAALKGKYDAQGHRTFEIASSTLTDDRGDYRLYWLDPGDYLVSAAFVPAERQTSDEPVQRVIYAPSYYPAASDVSNAQRLSLHAGDEMAVSFRLIRAKAVSVAGTVTLPGNEARSLVTVSVALAGDASYTIRYLAKTDERGGFRIVNVAPGDYVISAETVARGERMAASVHLIVKDRDENNIGLMLTAGVPVSARIVADAGRTLDIKATRLNLNSLDRALDSFASSAVQQNGMPVAIGVQRGTYSVHVEDLPNDTYLMQIHSGSMDLTTQPLPIGWDSPPELEVLVGVDGGRVNGSAVDAAGQSFAGAQVVLIPDPERRNRPDQYRAVASNDDGRFEIGGIPPGDYRLLAFENIDEQAWLNSDVIQRFLDGGMPIRISANSRIATQVKVIPEQR